MSKAKALLFTSAASMLVPLGLMAAPASSPTHPTIETKKVQQNSQQLSPVAKSANFKPFTGKIIGDKVRLRTAPDLDSFIIREFEKDELVVVLGEKNDFYLLKPPADCKAYIFRSFVLDDIVEGNRVNVRLLPDKESPVIGHLSTGAKVEGKISEENGKWLEIDPPENTVFYVSKEYVEYLGGPELKEIKDKRKASVLKLLDSTNLLTQSELRKPYDEIDSQKIEENYKTIINEYTDFPKQVGEAQKALSMFQEKFLQKKIAFLEKKANRMNQKASQKPVEMAYKQDEKEIAPPDRMKIWEPIEEALYLSWSAMHYAKTMDDFYADQRLKAFSISGILEAYPEAVKNKPGDFVLKENDLPVAYLYSTQVNLQDYIGKRVTLSVSKRPNNNFAFPAFYVHEIEE